MDRAKAASNTPGGFMSRLEIASLFGVSPATIDRWAGVGGFPVKVKLSPVGRRVGFRISDVEAYKQPAAPG